MARKKIEKAVVPAAPLQEFSNGVKVEYVKKGSVVATTGGYDMVVKFEHVPEEVPFHATADDYMEHGVWLFNQAELNAFGEAAPYERPLPTEADLQAELDKIWPDVVLGLATEAELSLAKALRTQIKAMQA